MRLTITSKGDFSNVKSWLAEVVNETPMTALKHVGEEGIKSLEDSTPKDTGETAASWDYQIESISRKGFELWWINTAHPHLPFVLARRLDTGYGTGTGGYVAPRPYISDAMTRAYRRTDAELTRELFKT